MTLLLLLVALFPFPTQVRIPGPGGAGVGGGGGGTSLSDTFGGSSVDLTKWTVVTVGSGTVTESGGYLNITGDGNWGHAYVESVNTWDRTVADITITVTINSPTCGSGDGTLGWGNGIVNGTATDQSDMYFAFGTNYFVQHDSSLAHCTAAGQGSAPCDVQGPSGFSGCVANTDVVTKMVIHSTGADLYFGGSGTPAATLDSRDIAAWMNNKHVFLTSFSGLAKFKNLTVTQP